MSEERPTKLSFPADYVIPEVWKPDEQETHPTGNRPTAGARFESNLPKGEHPYQLYSLGTPNGIRVTILFEELNQLKGTEYDAWRIDITKGEQFGSAFVDVNPNAQIPALFDVSVDPPLRIFESGSILKYVAEKEGAFIPKDPRKRLECFNWLFWQVGAAPLMGRGFMHFYRAPVQIKYVIDVFAMETKRQFGVLDQHLAKNQFLAGDEYSIADMAVWPWTFTLQASFNGIKFLEMDKYTHLQRWMDEIKARPAVQRGKRVNGFREDSILNRHSRADFFDVKKEDE